MNLQQVVGGNVARLRGRKGWSQEQLADVSGLHRTYISQIETAARNPTLAIIERLAYSLEVAPHELLQETTPLQGGA